MKQLPLQVHNSCRFHSGVMPKFGDLEIPSPRLHRRSDSPSTARQSSLSQELATGCRQCLHPIIQHENPCSTHTRGFLHLFTSFSIYILMNTWVYLITLIYIDSHLFGNTKCPGHRTSDWKSSELWNQQTYEQCTVYCISHVSCYIDLSCIDLHIYICTVFQM